MIIVDISDFKILKCPPFEQEVYFVVKSLDQRERRRRLIEQKRGGQIGRIQPRPVAEGLLVRATLGYSGIEVHWAKSYREPRHICPAGENNYLLSEINRLLCIDSNGGLQRVYHHPWFSFLHTVHISPDQSRILVVSSGFDMILELERESGDETWRWSAWDHGFSTDANGIHLTASRLRYEQLLADNIPARLVIPEEFGEQGLVTFCRSAHPNLALYDDNKGRNIVFCIAHSGKLYQYDRLTGKMECVADFLHQMPHGLQKFPGGWLITDTTKGKIFLLNSQFTPLKRIDLFNIDEKDPEAGYNEWIQTTLKLNDYSFLVSDANRGLLYVDIQNGTRFAWKPNPQWCIQDLIMI